MDTEAPQGSFFTVECPPRLHEQEFVPNEWKSHTIFLEHLKDHGRPLVSVVAKGAMVDNLFDTFFLGMGNFVVVLDGIALYLLWEIQYFVDLGVQPQNVVKYLAGKSPKQWDQIFKACSHMVLKKGDVVWIPAGCIVQKIHLDVKQNPSN